MSAEVIELNLINRSADTNNSDVVIFQQNVAEDVGEIAVAWRVIKNLGSGWNHPFTYSLSPEVGAGDSWGNLSPRLKAENGDRFEMIKDNAGNVLKRSSHPATSPEEIEIANNLPEGAVDALIYRDGLIAARKSSVAPGEKAVFQFKPTIWVGVVSEISEGDLMNSAILSTVNTEISLLGIEAADLVWTGGGAGATATEFNFTLENVKHA